MPTTTEFRRQDPHHPGETAEERASRLERERALLEEGREDIRAGRSLDGAELEAWLDRLDGDEPLELPERSSRLPDLK